MDEKLKADPNNIQEMNLTCGELNQVTKIWLNEAKHAHKGFICRDFWESRIYSFIMETTTVKDRYVYKDEKDKIRGFITAKRDKNSDTKAYILELYVDSEYQGTGIGKELLEKLKDKYFCLTLSVYKQNSRAIEFYENHGFQQIGDERTEEITGLKKLDMKWERT